MRIKNESKKYIVTLVSTSSYCKSRIFDDKADAIDCARLLSCGEANGFYCVHTAYETLDGQWAADRHVSSFKLGSKISDDK